jgi:hypothetical protein
MNYIHRLKDEKAATAAELRGLLEGLLDLMDYLCSDKFREDSTVQVADVIHRINEAKSRAWDLRVETEAANYRTRQPKPCDYDHMTEGEVRRLPIFSTGGRGAILVCKKHHAQEKAAYPNDVPAWEELEIYTPE